jgi:hypothetical protein
MNENFKTIQMIDGKLTGSFGFWHATAAEFAEIFPGDGQDLEIDTDLDRRLGALAASLLAQIRRRPVVKQQINGLDGTLLIDAEDRREFLPPSLRERDWASRHLNEAQQRLTAGAEDQPPTPEGGWRHVQVITSARNCIFGIFRATASEFLTLFPGPGQDIEFAEDVFERLGVAHAVPLLTPIWQRPVAKSAVIGIHGTLFFDFQHRRQTLPVSKREGDRSHSAS